MFLSLFFRNFAVNNLPYMTKYPIGIQNFESLRMDGFAYYRVRVQVRVG